MNWKVIYFVRVSFCHVYIVRRDFFHFYPVSYNNLYGINLDFSCFSSPCEISSLVHLQEPWFRTAFLTACSSLACCFWKVLRKWSVPCFGTVPLCLLFRITVTTESAKPLPVLSALQLACQTVWWEPVSSFAVPVYRWLDALLLPSAIPTQSPIGAGAVTRHVGLTGLYRHSVLSWILSWDFAL